MVVGVRCRGVGALMGEAPRLVGPSGGWGPRGVGPGRAVVVLTWWERDYAESGVWTELRGVERVGCVGGCRRVSNDCMAIHLVCRPCFSVSYCICLTLWLGWGPVRHTLQ